MWELRLFYPGLSTRKLSSASAARVLWFRSERKRFRRRFRLDFCVTHSSRPPQKQHSLLGHNLVLLERQVPLSAFLSPTPSPKSIVDPSSSKIEPDSSCNDGCIYSKCNSNVGQDWALEWVSPATRDKEANEIPNKIDTSKHDKEQHFKQDGTRSQFGCDETTYP